MQRPPFVVIGPNSGEPEVELTGHLPAAPVPLVGRAQDIARVRGLLARDDVRLVTMTGPGGVGKTKFSPLRWRPPWPPASTAPWPSCRLPPSPTRILVLTAIAQVLDVQESGDRGLQEVIEAHLRSHPALLVLDNFEQVIAAAPVVAALLRTAPRLKLLVTSREVLHVRGEHEFPVAPLVLPDRSALVDATALMAAPAVQLFAQRASAVRPEFQLTEANAALVADICGRLDGLPLAIELAAARTKLLSLPALLARLADRLRVLTGGPRDLPLRQQTLRNTLAWSYDLLDPDEQRLFRCLAVFAGGCTLAGAAAVLGSPPDETGAPPDEASTSDAVLDLLGSLVDKSLLRRVENGPGEPHFAMLDTVAEFAREQLEARGEAEETGRRHAAHFLSLLQAASPELSGPRQERWMDRLEAEHENIRKAMRWSLTSDNVIIAMRMAGVLWRFWETRGHLTEGREWLDVIAAAGAQAPPELLADVLHGASRLAWLQGDYTQTQRYAEENLAICRALGSERGIAQATHTLAILAGMRREHAAAQTYYAEALGLWRKLGNDSNAARVLNSMGVEARLQHEYEQARALFQQSLDLHLTLGNKRSIAMALANLGFVAFARRDYPEAQAYFRESLTLRWELGYILGVADCLSGLASVTGATGDARTAARLFGAVEVTRQSIAYTLEPEYRTIHDEQVAAVRARLSPEAFQAAWTAGEQLSTEEAVAEALVLDRAPAAASGGTAEYAPARTATAEAPVTTPADEDAFRAAVHGALHNFARSAILQHTPLLDARLVRARAGADAPPATRLEALRAGIREAVNTLQEWPGDRKLYRAVYHMYIQPTGAQEQVAELLDIPYSTFRRHLKEGTRRVTTLLWEWEQQAPE